MSCLLLIFPFRLGIAQLIYSVIFHVTICKALNLFNVGVKWFSLLIMLRLLDPLLSDAIDPFTVSLLPTVRVNTNSVLRSILPISIVRYRVLTIRGPGIFSFSSSNVVNVDTFVNVVTIPNVFASSKLQVSFKSSII